MKHRVNITLAVAALLYGLCGIAQATTNVITFNGISGPGSHTAFENTPPRTFDGFTLTWITGNCGFMDSDWQSRTDISGWDDDFLALFEAASVIIERVGGGPFDVISLLTGSAFSATPSDLRVTGTFQVGGTVVANFSPAVGSGGAMGLETLTGFTDLVSLTLTDIESGNAGFPAVDDITIVSQYAPPPPPPDPNVFDFNNIAPQGGNVSLSSAPIIEDAYSMVRTNPNGGILDNDSSAYPSILAFDEGVLGSYDDGFSVTFTRTDGRPFAAKSLVIGALLADNGNGDWVLTGHLVGGGTADLDLRCILGENTTVNLPQGFGNILSLDITATPDGKNPVVDDLTFGDAVFSSLAVFDFNHTVPHTAPLSFTLTQGYTLSKYGYTMQNTVATCGLIDNDWIGQGDLSAFEDDVLGLYGTGGSSVRFTRDDGRPFNAISMIIGAIVGDNADFSVIGNQFGGGTVTANFSPDESSRTTEPLSGFTNLESLDITDTGSAGSPIIDDITFEAYVAPGSYIIID